MRVWRRLVSAGGQRPTTRTDRFLSKEESVAGEVVVVGDGRVGGGSSLGGGREANAAGGHQAKRRFGGAQAGGDLGYSSAPALSSPIGLRSSAALSLGWGGTA